MHSSSIAPSISACAVGSASSRVRLPALAITVPSRTSAAPIGVFAAQLRRPRLGEGDAHRIAALPLTARHRASHAGLAPISG
jgi:hypothetical protein